ncbi:MAG TPA: phage tail protein [Terriglobales bacterium]|nr:phage tail protein [Terriglobales bacterium]
MQRVLLPQVRIQRRCPWEFPSTLAQRQEAVNGGANGEYSRFYRCGYSPDVVGGAGKLNGTVAFTSCGFTRTDCDARGMFHQDSALNTTQRFGGIEFVPPATLVRSYRESGKHWSPVVNNIARYNDFVPLVYGTVWYSPSIVFARNDGNLTRIEVLLGTGEVNSVVKVLVNDIDIPQGRAGANMTGTGWFNLFSTGARTGGFNADFTDKNGNPLGDPYGSMAALSVVVPNRINDGGSLPAINVLLEGPKLDTYGTDGSFAAKVFTDNPAWILLDILRRCGWAVGEVDVASFAKVAAYADEKIQTQDVHGNAIALARFSCNLAITNRRTAGDVIRGIRNACRLYLTYGSDGLLELNVENTFALQQATKPDWSNSTSLLNGGWPSYEFSDGSSGASNIVRAANGAPTLTLTSRNIADTPNYLTVEFQDALNEYQQDSYSVVDVNDVGNTGQEITGTFTALGVPNYDQAARILKFNLDRSIRGNTYVQFQTSVKALGLRPGDLITLTYLKEGFTRQPFRILKIAPEVNYRSATITAQIHDDTWYDDTNGQVPGNSGAQRQPGTEMGLPRPLMGTVVDAGGNIQFGVTEAAAQAADGSPVVEATVAFSVPPSISTSAPGAPLLSLAPLIATTGGTLGGGESFYYAVSGVDSTGAEGNLSFIVRATIPSGPNTNTVTVSGLSFPAATTKFSVYRGPNPQELFRIASNQSIAAQFTDTGLAEQVAPPPDANFDHANFSWRMELLPEYSATLQGPDSVGNDTLEMTANAYLGMTVRITRGTGAGQERAILSNTATELQVSFPWDTEPDTSSYFVVAEAGWHSVATARTSPVKFEIPNQTGATIHISGRAANVNNDETPYALCTLTRWVIGGAGATDGDVPPTPSFGLGMSLTAGGTVELSGVSFPDLTNTHTITAGTFALYYWSELDGTPAPALASNISATDTFADLTAVGGAKAGSYIQLETEVAIVVAVLNNGLRYQLQRGADGSPAAAHASGIVVYVLRQKTQIVPFVRNFFGSPYSGSWSFPTHLPDCRIASAELFVTNVKGNSPTGAIFVTLTEDYGVRTLSGGQFSFQVEGFLAIETGATPDIIVENAHSVRDVFAMLRQAPVGGPIQLQINQDNALYCTLTIADGATLSNSVAGKSLPPLIAGARLSLDITAVGATNPGADMTVIIRL